MNKSNHRSPFAIVRRLIVLVKPMLPVMLAAIVMGVAGHFCATFITIFGGFAVLDLLGFATPVALKTTFVCVLLFALVRGIFRYAEQSCNHFIAFIQLNTNNTHRDSSCNTDIFFIKTDTHTILSYQNDLTLTICYFYFDQFILITQCNCGKSCLSYIHVLAKRCLLHKTFLCCHDQIILVAVVINRDYSSNLLARH